jgi:hypothetical protein
VTPSIMTCSIIYVMICACIYCTYAGYEHLMSLLLDFSYLGRTERAVLIMYGSIYRLVQSYFFSAYIYSSTSIE